MNFNLKNNALAIASAFMLIAFASCEKEEETPSVETNDLKGMFVVCEGNFGTSDGDVTWYHPDSTEQITNLFNMANDLQLGDILQSFAIVDTLGFLVVNNSQKVTVVNMRNFEFITSIDGFSYPRNIIKADNNRVLISNGNGFGNDYVYSVDIKTLTKTDSVAVGKGPEKMVKVDNNIYVANSGGWSQDSTVSMINLTTFKVTNTIIVGKTPVDLVADKNNNIWVYCKGLSDYYANPIIVNKNSGLVKVDFSTKIITTFTTTNLTSGGINNLAIDNNGENVYYITDALYKMAITSNQLPTNKFYDKNFYGVDVDPKSGQIVGLDEKGKEAHVINTNGTLNKKFTTGAFANSVVFNW